RASYQQRGAAMSGSEIMGRREPRRYPRARSALRRARATLRWRAFRPCRCRRARAGASGGLRCREGESAPPSHRCASPCPPPIARTSRSLLSTLPTPCRLSCRLRLVGSALAFAACEEIEQLAPIPVIARVLEQRFARARTRQIDLEHLADLRVRAVR